MYINEWKMSYRDKKDVKCSAPCSMYSVLYENGYIPDPFYAANELELRELSRYDCDFESEFTLTEAELSKDYLELVFFGLDTICEITLNGKLIDNTINMHRTYEYDVRNILRSGKNTVKLHFSSPVKYFEKMNNKHHLFTNSDTIPGAAHLRKALYMSGWDWAPTLPDMGIFRPVELRAYNVDRIDDVMIRQIHEDGRVSLVITAKTKYNASATELFAEVDGKRVKLNGGMAVVEIDDPKLWWPNGFGDQPLYDVKISLLLDNDVIDECKKTVGLRTLELSRAQLPDGSEFCFVVNGIKIFAKGANYVPMDSILSRITNDKLERIVSDCVFANFNCVRVWGGAYYPEDYFYELCDKAGIIVWQDFMIACINVWMRSEFEREITLEAIENVKRLRHHASLGLLCGNNEMEDGVCNWGLPDNLKVKVDFLKLYEDILFEICDKYAPDTPYLSSSPTSGGGFDKPQDPTRGDVHFWLVWNGAKPFDEYRKYKFRFCSEYGFESMPSAKTIDTFCPSDERNLFSYTMEDHQKHKGGNAKFLSYLAAKYQMPSTLEGLVYATQLNQAHAIKFGVEHFRRIRGYCMGSIYWQLNDCWPVSSWSSIDYFGRYKALHYFARKFYAPVAIGLFSDENQVIINLANETLFDFAGKIKVGVMDADFNPTYTEEYDVSVASLKSRDVCVCDFAPVYKSREKFFFADLYDNAGNFIMRQTELGIEPKFFKFKKPEISVKAESCEVGVKLYVSSNTFVKNLEIGFVNSDPHLSDNYFDIATGDAVEVIVYTDLAPEELVSDMHLRSVYDIPHK